MAYLTEREVRSRAAQVTRRSRKGAGTLLAEDTAPSDQTFDVFLSHSSAEPEEILLGVKDLLVEQGLSVYVDMYSDPQLSPDVVTIRTANIIRNRMRKSRTLLYVHSQYSRKSRWMPWELGYFDGLKGMVGVLPVIQNPNDAFKGEEYLSLYPYVDVAAIEGTRDIRYWINANPKTYARLDLWAHGQARIIARAE